MKATAELKMLPVSVLKPAAYNPRKKLKPGDKEYEKIKNSIEEFGFADPLVVNADMTIIGGHQRLTVAMALGYTEVPCAVVDIDKTREKALNIALNKITGAWDDSLLADLLKDIENSNFDLGKTGFEPPEIETLFNKVHDKDIKEDDFDLESELKQPTFSQAGDLWMLGRHRVLCGDSTKAECYDMAAIASALCSIRGVDIPTSTCAVAIRMLVRIRSAHIVLLSQHKRMIVYSYTVSKTNAHRCMVEQRVFQPSHAQIM